MRHLSLLLYKSQLWVLTVRGSNVECLLHDACKTIKVSCNLCLREQCFKKSNKFDIWIVRGVRNVSSVGYLWRRVRLFKSEAKRLLFLFVSLCETRIPASFLHLCAQYIKNNVSFLGVYSWPKSRLLSDGVPLWNVFALERCHHSIQPSAVLLKPKIQDSVFCLKMFLYLTQGGGEGGVKIKWIFKFKPVFWWGHSNCIIKLDMSQVWSGNINH